MQIDNIQTYNNSNNFKALRFKNGCKFNLANMPEKVLSKVDSVRNGLADTKYYHLDIGPEEFYISHENGEKFYLPILVNKAGKVLILKFRQGLTQISKKLRYETDQEAVQATERIRKTETQFERTAEIVKVLDDYERKLKP